MIDVKLAALYEEHGRLAEKLCLEGLTEDEQRRLASVRERIDFWQRVWSVSALVAGWDPDRRAAARLAIAPEEAHVVLSREQLSPNTVQLLKTSHDDVAPDVDEDVLSQYLF